MLRRPFSCNACESLLKFKSYMSFNKILVYFRVFVFTSYYSLQIWILTFAHRHLSITRHILIFIIFSRVTDWLERNNNFWPFKLLKGEEVGGMCGASFHSYACTLGCKIIGFEPKNFATQSTGVVRSITNWKHYCSVKHTAELWFLEKITLKTF